MEDKLIRSAGRRKRKKTITEIVKSRTRLIESRKAQLSDSHQHSNAIDFLRNINRDALVSEYERLGSLLKKNSEQEERRISAIHHQNNRIENMLRDIGRRSNGVLRESAPSQHTDTDTETDGQMSSFHCHDINTNTANNERQNSDLPCINTNASQSAFRAKDFFSRGFPRSGSVSNNVLLDPGYKHWHNRITCMKDGSEIRKGHSEEQFETDEMAYWRFKSKVCKRKKSVWTKDNTTSEREKIDYVTVSDISSGPYNSPIKLPPIGKPSCIKDVCRKNTQNQTLKIYHNEGDVMHDVRKEA